MSSTPLDSVIALLATSLGEDAAREIVAREAHAAGLHDLSTREDLVALLRRVEKLGGTAGLAARLAITRIERGVPLVSDDTSSVVDAPKSQPRDIAVSVIIATFAPTFGEEQATTTVHKALAATRIRSSTLTKDEAAQVLEWLVAQGGALGTVARFAKVRLLLRK